MSHHSYPLQMLRHVWTALAHGSVVRVLTALLLVLASLPISVLVPPGSPLAPRTAEGASISVTTTADEVNVNGLCSLREAIINANNNNQSGSADCAAGSGADIITLPAGTYNLTIAGTPGIDDFDPAVSDLDIRGLAAHSP